MRAIHLFSVALLVPVALGFGPAIRPPKKKFKIRPIPIMAAKERVFNMRSLPPVHTNTHFVPVPQPLPLPSPPVQHFTQVFQPPRREITHTQNFVSTPQHINIPPAPPQQPTSIKNNIWLSTKSDVSGSQTSTSTGSSSGSNGVEIVQPLPKVLGTSGGGGSLSGLSINGVTVGGGLNKIGGISPSLGDSQFGLGGGSVGIGAGRIAGSDQSLFIPQGTNFGTFGGGITRKGFGTSATGILDIHGSSSGFPSVGSVVDSGVFTRNIQTPFIHPGLGSNFQNIGNGILSGGRVLNNAFIGATGNGFHPVGPSSGGFVGTSTGGSFGIPSGRGIGVGHIGSGFGAFGLGSSAGGNTFGVSSTFGNAGLGQFGTSAFVGNGGPFGTPAGSGVFGGSRGFSTSIGSGGFGGSGGFSTSIGSGGFGGSGGLSTSIGSGGFGGSGGFSTHGGSGVFGGSRSVSTSVGSGGFGGSGGFSTHGASGVFGGGGGFARSVATLLAAAALKKPAQDHEPGEGNGNILQTLLSSGLGLGGGGSNLGASLGFNGSIRRFLSSGGSDGGGEHFSYGDDDD